MNIRKTVLRGASLGLLAGTPWLLGCSQGTTTRELVNARSAYAEATAGPAGRYAPAFVQEAQVALREAEAVHADDPGSPEEQNVAYVAWRKAQLANVHGNTQAARVDSTLAEKRYAELQDELRRAAEGKLEATEQTLDKTAEQLQAEKLARMKAQEQLAAAMQSLADIAKFKQEGDDLTLTLDGAVLFETDKATLLPLAKDKLQRVADVLMKQGEKIVVIGHTDSTGDDAHNQKLSQDRAESVRAFLVERGVDSSMIEAKGMGEAQPLTSNNTPEGRADNRRVEIVVKGGGAAATK